MRLPAPGLVLMLAVLAFGGGLARAQATGGADPRVRTVFYNPDRVVPLDLYDGYQLAVQFGPDERIENVAIGEGASWQVTPNHEASMLFIKPMEHAARTNMTVVTDRRTYLFELEAHGAARAGPQAMTYLLRFAYPPPPAVATAAPPPKPPPPERRNTDFAYSGSAELVPSTVFDDGRFTYFQWPSQAVTPAVFVVDADGQETLANYSHRDGLLVIEQIAPRFRLRDGRKVTNVVNLGWRAPAAGAQAPRPLDPRSARQAARREAGS